MKRFGSLVTLAALFVVWLAALHLNPNWPGPMPIKPAAPVVQAVR